MSVQAYRCVECGDGEHLTAYAQSVSFGSLAADGGDLSSIDHTDTCFVFDDSVSCSRHGETEVEALVEGVWSVWSRCAECEGKGRRVMNFGRTFWKCDACNGEGGHFVPAPAPEPPAPEDGP